MPELPEVETVRRGLAPALVGHVVTHVDQRRGDLRIPFPDGFAERLAGRRIEALERRAKYILAPLDDGSVLVLHLGMSGRVTIGWPDAHRRALGAYVHDTGGMAAHDHLVLTMSNGAVVTYNDPRRFGLVTLIPAAALAAHDLFRGLGVEPLGPDLDARYLAHRARDRRSDLKSFLLDQRIIAGLGNIYVCEALFRAKLSPFRAAGTLARASGAPSVRAERLVPEIRAVLEEAIAAGGSSLRDYRHADGALGYFQHRFRVYGREGEPCVTPGCRGIVQRHSQAGRSTFACPHCQR